MKLTKQKIRKAVKRDWVRDDGLLDIGKYGENELVDWIYELIKKIIKERIGMLRQYAGIMRELCKNTSPLPYRVKKQKCTLVKSDT